MRAAIPLALCAAIFLACNKPAADGKLTRAECEALDRHVVEVAVREKVRATSARAGSEVQIYEDSVRSDLTVGADKRIDECPTLRSRAERDCVMEAATTDAIDDCKRLR